MKRFAVTTLGCKVNQYDGQALSDALRRHGLTPADARAGEPADLVVINTCCVTATAMRKSRQAIRRALRACPQAAVLVTGCYSDYDGRRIAELLAALGVPPERTVLAGHHGDPAAAVTQLVRAILGSGGRPDECRMDTADFLGGVDGCQGVSREARDADDAENIASPETIRTRRTAAVKLAPPTGEGLGPIDHFDGHQRAFVKVQDGCDAFCAYCVVPFTRPRVRSRQLVEILDECRRLVAGGHKEIVLCGVFLGAFGRPTAIRRKWQIPAGDDHGAAGHDACVFAPPQPLPALVRGVAEIPGLWRVRLSSLEPLDVTDELLALAADLPAVAPHFHLPLQSGSPHVLRRMNRQYTADDFGRTVDRIRTTLDRPALTTDIIVGFPGETDEDFAATLAVARLAGFAKIHAFPFSPVKGTAAWTYRHQAPPPETVRARLAELADLERQLAGDYREQFVGATLEALVEAEGNGDWLRSGTLHAASVPVPISLSRAMTDRYLAVTFAPPPGRDPAALIGQVVRLRITRTTRGGLAGELVE